MFQIVILSLILFTDECVALAGSTDSLFSPQFIQMPVLHTTGKDSSKYHQN